jgi:hypothetical protein
MPARRFEDVDIWKRAHGFVLETYRLSETFPKQELFGLTSQLRRAAVSIAANLAQGSLEECRYYLILIRDLGYARTDEMSGRLEEISKMLASYMHQIRNDRG